MNRRLQWTRDWQNWRALKRRLPKNLAKNLALALLALGMVGSLGILGLFAFVSRDLPDPNQLTERTIKQSTKIYDRTGEHLLYEIFNDENRTLAKLQEGFCKDNPNLETNLQGIPLLAIQATIAAEDRTFCSHKGFVVKSLVRAVIFGGSRGGGSTLTQQLVKNAILSNERTLTRKVKELILSIELERRYSKDEILQIYFNEIPFGSTYYGIEAASQNYFGKSANTLTLAEAATLSALPQLPTFYINNPDRLKARRDWILDSMAELGFVSKEEASTAKDEETPVRAKVSDITAPHFVFHVKELLEERYGRRQTEEGGLKVITSLDLDLQKAAEDAVVEGVEEHGEQYKFNNASLVAIDPKTGQVLAMVGSKDYFDDEIQGQVNVSTRPRQPGSSFKPIVYAKAFEMGYTPNTVLWDVKTTFSTAMGSYTPNNYDLNERGPIRLRDALQGSLNIPAVKLLYLVGVENALNFAETLGYTTFTDRSNFGLAIVLGGAEVELLDHVNAYATFANEGVHLDPVAILRVEEVSGNVLEEWKSSEGRKALEPNVARMITNVLADNSARAYIFGTGSYLQLGARPAAAKTGTTNDYHDAWTVGYVPSLAVGVWVGNADNAEMKRGADGSIIAAPIWNTFMKKALEDKPIDYFTPPGIPTTGKAVLDGALESTTVAIDRATGKLATEFTPSSFREEKTFAQYHEILHYIDRFNPLGPPPADPNRDLYYASWEATLSDWIKRKEMETGIVITQMLPPTEYDDLHVPANFPTVQIVNPPDGYELQNRDLTIAADANAPRSVRRVDFYIDELFLGSDSQQPYILQTNIPNTIERGYHTLKAVAFDDIDNSSSATVGVVVASDATETSFKILEPQNGQTIENINGSYTVTVSIESPEHFRYVMINAIPMGTGDSTRIGAKIDPNSPFLSFDWTLPSDGDWILTAVAEPREGFERLETAGIVVHVVTTAAPAPIHEGEQPPADQPAPSLPPLDPFITIP